MGEDQKGFTLVELLIATAIASVVLAAVCGFLIVGSRSYVEAGSDIDVQQEAQLALNQMTDVLIDTTRSIQYAGYDSGGSPVLALKDSEFMFEPVGKSLTMYNGVKGKGADGTETLEEGNGNKNYQFYWDKANEILWYAEVEITRDTFPAPGDSEWVVFADHVTDFGVDLTQMEERQVVQIAMTVAYGGRVYSTSNNVTLRNKTAVNDAEIKALDRSRTLSIYAKDSGVVLEPGETFHFSTPMVSGTNVTDRSVTWSMDPAYSGNTDFVDSENGILRVADDESAGTVGVVITTNAADSEGRHASTQLSVCIKRVSDVELGKIGDEDTENGAVEVSAGKEFTVQAKVNGMALGIACDGCLESVSRDTKVVNWTVEGNAVRTDTRGNSQEAVFRVSEDAKEGDEIVVRVTSNLSARRAYPDVIGGLRLRVAK